MINDHSYKKAVAAIACREERADDGGIVFQAVINDHGYKKAAAVRKADTL